MRVSLRPRQRRRRNHLALALAAAALLGVAAASALRHDAGGIDGSLARLHRALTPAATRLELSCPIERVRRSAAGLLASRGRLSPAAAAAAIRRSFPYLRVVVRRHWLRRAASLELSLRAAVAVTAAPGARRDYLSDDGIVFGAPGGLYALAAPLVETARASPAQLREASAICEQAAEPGALPSPLQSLRLAASPQDGWAARLADGTEVLFGDGRWLGQKFSRLNQVLADARARPAVAPPFTADLRYFGDGKILLRPLGPASQ